MKQDDIVNFIFTLNALQPFLTPIQFNQLVSHPISRQLEGVANGVLVCELKPAAPREPIKAE